MDLTGLGRQAVYSRPNLALLGGYFLNVVHTFATPNRPALGSSCRWIWSILGSYCTELHVMTFPEYGAYVSGLAKHEQFTNRPEPRVGDPFCLMHPVRTVIRYSTPVDEISQD